MPTGSRLGVAHSSPGPCPALVVTCAFDPPRPKPLIYTKVSCFQKKKKKSSKRKKLVTYKGNSIRLSEKFSEKLAREWHNILKVMNFFLFFSHLFLLVGG